MELSCHAGPEEPAPYVIRGHPDVVPTPYYGVNSSREPLILDSGFHRKLWIPAGVYPDENRGQNHDLLETVSLWTNSNYRGLVYRTPSGVKNHIPAETVI
jgi:hypothetical protein